MANSFNKILLDLRKKQAQKDSRPLPTLTIKREPSVTERNAVYRGPGYGLLFCVHSKSYFEPCSACRRNKADARLYYKHWCERYGLNL